MTRLLFAARLVLVFLADVVLSGLTTAWLIVRPGRGTPTPGFLRMPFSGLDARGAAVLGGMITLTPGTTTLDIDLDAETGQGELLLHLLDASDPEGAARAIHRRLVGPLRRVFPGPPGRTA
ncbi:MAG: Na+/H+ antiporter subunit E [Sandaracinaceae bacterium]